MTLDAELEWRRLALAADERRLARVRASTSRLYRSNLLDFTTFCTARGLEPPLPSSTFAITAYLEHCVRDRRLAASTIDSRVAALKFWHRSQSAQVELLGLPSLDDPLDVPALRDLVTAIRKQRGGQAKGRLPLTKAEWRMVFSGGFDLRTAHGLHHRLCFLLCTLGCLRRVAATHLVVRFSWRSGQVVYDPASHVQVLRDDDLGQSYIRLAINVDKNVDIGDTVYAYIPAVIPGLDVRPLDVLRDYMLRVRPRSGSYLLSAPRSRALPATSFHEGTFGAMAGAFQDAVRRALPQADPSFVARVGSHSGRKSLAQWLWDAFGNKRLIMDVGHWRSREDAASIYFCCSRRVILECLAQL